MERTVYPRRMLTLFYMLPPRLDRRTNQEKTRRNATHDENRDEGKTNTKSYIRHLHLSSSSGWNGSLFFCALVIVKVLGEAREALV